MLKKIYLALILAILSLSCTKLDQFSAENEIRSFVVSTHSPQEIIIDDVQVKQDTIFIPIVYGRYEFPMRFKAEVRTSENIDKIVGVDFAKEQTFENIESNIKFYIVAQNGSTREYHLRPMEIPLNENNRIASTFQLVSVAPTNAIVSTKLHTTSNEDTVKVYGVDLTYPVTIVPRFTIAQKAKFGKIYANNNLSNGVDFENGVSQFTFGDQKTSYTLAIKAESGLKKDWIITSQNIASFVATPETPESAIRSTSINPRSSSAKVAVPMAGGSSLQVGEMRIDNRNAKITIVIEQASQPGARSVFGAKTKAERAAPITSPLSIETKLSLLEWVDLVDMTRDTILTFEGYQDIKTFYIIDPIDNIARRWTVELSETKSDAALVESFSYNYTARPCGSKLTGGPWPSIDMDISQVYIYPQEREIALVYRSYVNDVVYTNWGVTLNDINIQVSKDATINLPEISWLSTGRNQAKTLLAESRSFEIISEAGDTTVWNIRLQANSVKPSTESSIEEFSIKRVIPIYATFKEEAVMINRETNEILLNLENDAAAYPMQIFPQYRLANYAQIISQNGGLDPLVFANSKSTQEIVVMAQDGADSNKSVYTVKLISSEKPVGAEIESITIGGVEPEGFTLEQSTASIDKDNGIITLFVSSDADTKFPMSVSYSNLSVSEGATTNLPERGKITFNNSNHDVLITVNPIQGDARIWKVRLSYRTQLNNWKLDNWGGNTPLPTQYWATANNSFGTGTKPGPGVSGLQDDKCATLTTSNMMGKIAAGSLFLGWFDSENIVAGLNDPVVLTFFGIPYRSTMTIKGITFDASYTPGAGGDDWGSASIYLINWDGKAPYVFHGNRPGETPNAKGDPHPKNTATMAAEASIKLSTKGTTTKYGHPAVEITAGEWKKGITLNVDGSAPFTHIAVVFSSSAYGDYFEGQEGSTLKIDNVKLVY